MIPPEPRHYSNSNRITCISKEGVVKYQQLWEIIRKSAEWSIGTSWRSTSPGLYLIHWSSLKLEIQKVMIEIYLCNHLRSSSNILSLKHISYFCHKTRLLDLEAHLWTPLYHVFSKFLTLLQYIFILSFHCRFKGTVHQMINFWSNLIFWIVLGSRVVI